MKLLRKLALVLCIGLALLPASARGQDAQPAGPVYVVQSGDTLWAIAQRFGVSLDDLVAANSLVDANSLKAGDALIIPGLAGVTGRLETHQVVFGETLTSLSRRYQVSVDKLALLNHLVAAAEVYAGYNLIVPLEDNHPPELARRAMLGKGQSMLELAVLQGTNPWQLAAWNGVTAVWSALPGDVLHLPGEDTGPGALPPVFQRIEVTPLPLIQGRTTVLRLAAGSEVTLTGSFLGRPLNFFAQGTGEYAALQGVYALQPAGIFPLTLQGTLADGSLFGITQYISVVSGEYAIDPDLSVDPATIDPQVTKPEDSQWTALAQPATPDKLWDGPFAAPVAKDFVDCWPSQFGNRRSYNSGTITGFHTGLDYCGAVGNPIFAPAAGVVVFAGPLTVRGNATMIDHGRGVYTGYMHQSEIQVQVGQRVEAGQQIGLVGNTGRVTGPHLHFEVWVGGVQVQPFDWLENSYP